MISSTNFNPSDLFNRYLFNDVIIYSFLLFCTVDGMKPNRPRVINSSRNHITIGWDSCDFLILKQIEGILEDNQKRREENDSEDERRWYTLERKDRVLGWFNAYM